MSIIHRDVTINYSTSQMFRLVDTVEDYPSFLPWCNAVEVHERTDDEVRATIELAMRGVHRQFTTCNRLQKDKMIEIRLLNGPFRHLEGFWRFEAVHDRSSRVIFDLEFEFSNRLLAFAIEPIFQQIANSLVHTFVERAEEIYGK